MRTYESLFFAPALRLPSRRIARGPIEVGEAVQQHNINVVRSDLLQESFNIVFNRFLVRETVFDVITTEDRSNPLRDSLIKE